jgi:signal recognition particle receptor subunit beta
MPLLNNMRREISCKVVYYGPALSGKTTNLVYIHGQIAPTARGELISLATMTDRTLFFDFLPVDLGEVMGWKLRFALYTVPGQIEYAQNRKFILNGADGVVFVADSDPFRQADNIESLEGMVNNMAEYGLTPENTPLVMQYNKRDLLQAMSLKELEQALNLRKVPSFESVATQGPGVFSTLRGVSKLMIDNLKSLVS